MSGLTSAFSRRPAAADDAPVMRQHDPNCRPIESLDDENFAIVERLVSEERRRRAAQQK